MTRMVKNFVRTETLRTELPEWVRNYLNEQNRRKPDNSSNNLFWTRVAYKNFLRNTKSYEKNPKDLAAVREFIQYHPLFWNVRTEDSKFYGFRNNIIMTRGWDQIYFEIIPGKKNKKATVILEAGGTTADRVTFYHDYSLDVASTSIDKAYIKMAARIHKFYNEHGALRNPEKGINGSEA